jgi:hypothetical protein
MQLEKKKQLKMFGIGFLCALILSVTFVYSQTVLTPMTLTKGIYPSATTYTVWKEGTTYFAKNVYGSMLDGYELGSSNATTIIQNTVINNGKTILEPATYYIDGLDLSAVNSFTLCGNSNPARYSGNLGTSETPHASTILYLNNGANSHVISFNPLTYDTLGDYIRIEDLSIYGNKDNQVGSWDGIYIKNCLNAQIYNVAIQNCSDYSLYILDSEEIFIRDFVSIYSKSGAFLSGNSLMLDNCEIACLPLFNNERTGSRGIYVGAGDNIVIENANVYYAQYGIFIENSLTGVKLSRIHVHDNSRDGIYITDSNYVMIHQAICYDNSNVSASSYCGIKVEANSNYTRISDSTLNDYDGIWHSQQWWGIWVAATADGTMIANTICLFDTGGGIKDLGTNTKIFESWNKTNYIATYP